MLKKSLYTATTCILVILFSLSPVLGSEARGQRSLPASQANKSRADTHIRRKHAGYAAGDRFYCHQTA
jgi:hypothetical protein